MIPHGNPDRAFLANTHEVVNVSRELGALANRNPPGLDTHDRFGNRIDLVKFHPAYHTLMRTAIEHGIHSSHWSNPGAGAHVARAAHSYLQSQVEAGHGCVGGRMVCDRRDAPSGSEMKWDKPSNGAASSRFRSPENSPKPRRMVCD